MRKIYATSSLLFTLTAEADRVLCQLVICVTVFFYWMSKNEIQLLSRVFCYSWLVCLLVFWLREASLVKVGNPISDDRFRFSPCSKTLKRYWPYLIPFSSCISNGNPE